MKYVVDGTKRYHTNNQEITVSKNQYLVLNSSEITTEAKKGTKGLSLFLSPKLMDEISDFHYDSNTALKFLEVTQRRANQKIKNLLDKIVYLYEHDQISLGRQIDDLFMIVSELIVQEQISIDGHFENLSIVK